MIKIERIRADTRFRGTDLPLPSGGADTIPGFGWREGTSHG